MSQLARMKSGIVVPVTREMATAGAPPEAAVRIREFEHITWADLLGSVKPDHIPEFFSGTAVMVASNVLENLECHDMLNELCAVFADALEENGYSYAPFTTCLRKPLPASPTEEHGRRRLFLNRTLHIWLGFKVCTVCCGSGGVWTHGHSLRQACPQCGKAGIHMGWEK